MRMQFGLILMVNHACDLRCTYCYAGAKSHRPMPQQIARKAIDRAVASLDPGGTLHLGFFGGEPLLEADLMICFIRYAAERTRAAGVSLGIDLTTNGTVTGPAAWSLMTMADCSLAVSHDGLPEIHDRHRRFADGSGSSEKVGSTIRRLLDAGKDVRTAMVVRPDTVDSFADGLRYLQGLGVRLVEPSLDLWTHWEVADICRLEAAITKAADLWREQLPHLSIGWFDDKAARLARIAIPESTRCGFGAGEIAVAPSGRLYPCERLIGTDDEANPLRLPGHALDGEDFLGYEPPCGRCHSACKECAIVSLCDTTCRCSNYVRTGDCGKPDDLLCRLNKACVSEVLRVLEGLTGMEEPNERSTAHVRSE